jgi:predicted acyltransferase
VPSIETNAPVANSEPRARDLSVDQLRGIAVLGMVLSGAVAYGDVLPAWMFHAQVPPPLHKFNSAIAGVTWVDLVFPFFLFCMGAAIPLAHRASFGVLDHRSIWAGALRRTAILAWFALIVMHLRASALAAKPELIHHLGAIGAFVLCGVALASGHFTHQRWPWLRWFAFAVSLVLLALYPFYDAKGFAGFQFKRNDIILIVLANMAFFGALIYGYTQGRPLLRLAVLPFVAGILITGQNTASVTNLIYSATPFHWLYRFDFLKYLFIVVPAMVVGEVLLQDARRAAGSMKRTNSDLLAVFVLSVTFVAGLTGLLFIREVIAAFGLALGLVAVLYWMSRRQFVESKLLLLAAYLLLIGFAFEPYQGGIKKDPSSFSYFFIMSGLSCVALVGLRAMNALVSAPNLWLAQVGQNAMVAYVAGSLLITPVLHITGLYSAWAAMKQNAWMGFAKGLVYTLAVAAVTIYATRKRWVWKS